MVPVEAGEGSGGDMVKQSNAATYLGHQVDVWMSGHFSEPLGCLDVWTCLRAPWMSGRLDMSQSPLDVWTSGHVSEPLGCLDVWTCLRAPWMPGRLDMSQSPFPSLLTC